MNTRDYDAATRADLLLDGTVWEVGTRWELHSSGRVRTFTSYTWLLLYLNEVEDRRDAANVVRKGVKP